MRKGRKGKIWMKRLGGWRRKLGLGEIGWKGLRGRFRYLRGLMRSLGLRCIG